MNEVKKLLKKHAEWQKTRRALSWPEKIRLAEQIRDSVLKWRKSVGKDFPKNQRD